MSMRERVVSWIQRLRHGPGLETDGMVHLEDLGLAAEERRNYGPSGWKTIDRLARRIPLGPEDVFADYGCGKGRIVYLAALHPPVPDDLTIAFFYSPFTGRLFEGVVDNLRRSVERQPRRLWIVHQRLADSHAQHPAVLCGRHLGSLDWLDPVDRIPNGPAVLECFRARGDRGASAAPGSAFAGTGSS